MASTLPSTLSSDHKYYSTTTLCTPQDQLTRSNVTQMHYNLRMWLDQEDCFFPLSNNYYGCLDELIFQESTNNFGIDSSSNSSYSITEVPSFGTSAFGYYNSHSNSHTNSSGSTYYDELESNNNNVYSTYAPCTNNDVTPPQCWEYEGHTTTQVTGSENSNTKVGKYSAEEKRERILRYLKKRNQRNFRKTIKYACRKTLADRRVRIRGRFAKNHEDESLTNYDCYRNIIQENKSNNNKMEQYGEFNKEWVQEAMCSLLYVPSISCCHSNGPKSFLGDYE